uniref:C2H2-type domain-containing protein n=1 Tax=Neogobius melanostomus TaxID=47308 RepID=A0A8C6SRM4_9GOBI
VTSLILEHPRRQWIIKVVPPNKPPATALYGTYQRAAVSLRPVWQVLQVQQAPGHTQKGSSRSTAQMRGLQEDVQQKAVLLRSVRYEIHHVIPAQDPHAQAHGERPYPCDQCGKAFASTVCLLQHKRNHSNDRPYECEQCGSGFKNKGALTGHMLIHMGERQHACDECGKLFRQGYNLLAHKRRVHNKIGEKKFSCPVCTKRFWTVRLLKAHKRTHKEPAYRCDQCGKCLKTIYNLSMHMQRHKGYNLIYCGKCRLNASSAEGVHNQKRIEKARVCSHGEKRYKCQQCRKLFATVSHLNRHNKFTHGEKRHECDQCGKAFADSLKLKRHLLTHSATKPRQFGCNRCGKYFQTMSIYRQHYNTHTKEIRYPCERCGTIYYVRSSLTQHLRKCQEGRSQSERDRGMFKLRRLEIRLQRVDM